MGESELTIDLRSESEVVDFARETARAWHAAGCFPLIVGLRGELGAGKTTWVRAALRGLGYAGRVPSPTYTLLEQYDVGDLVVVHLDLYRLAGEEELENLGLRDWLERAATWLLVEWPERAPTLAARADIEMEIAMTDPGSRRLAMSARTRTGIRALRTISQLPFKYGC